MNSIRKTILFLSNTLQWREIPDPSEDDEKSLHTTVQKKDSVDVFGYKGENSKLSTSYRAIKRMTYQKWQ